MALSRLTIALLILSLGNPAAGADLIWPKIPPAIPCNWGTPGRDAASVGVVVPNGNPDVKAHRVFCENVDGAGEVHGFIKRIPGSSRIVYLQGYAYSGLDCTGLSSLPSADRIIVTLKPYQRTHQS